MGELGLTQQIVPRGLCAVTHFNLLLGIEGTHGSLDDFVRAFFVAVGVSDYVERESAHCVEERYFLGQSHGIVFKAMRSDDDDHADLPFWISMEIADSKTNAFDLDEFVRQHLLPAGFKVAHLRNFGMLDEQRRDF
jgi:hypothetical protein